MQLLYLVVSVVLLSTQLVECIRITKTQGPNSKDQPVSVSPDDPWTANTPWNNELNFRYRLVMNAFKAYATDVVKKHLNIKAEDIVKTVTKINGIKTTDQKWQTHADIENMDVVANLFGSDKNSPEAQRYAKAWAECRVNLLDPRFKERHHESEDDPWSYLAVARQLNVLLASVAKKLTTQDSKTIKNREAEYERWLAKKDVNNRKLVFMDNAASRQNDVFATVQRDERAALNLAFETIQTPESVSSEDWTEKKYLNNELNFRYRLVMNAFKAYATDVVKKHLNIREEDRGGVLDKILRVQKYDEKWQTNEDIPTLDELVLLFRRDENSPKAERCAKAWEEARVNLLDPRFKRSHHKSEDDPWSYLAVARQLNGLLASVATRLTQEDSNMIKHREEEYERWLTKKVINTGQRKLVFMDNAEGNQNDVFATVQRDERYALQLAFETSETQLEKTPEVSSYEPSTGASQTPEVSPDDSSNETSQTPEVVSSGEPSTETTSQTPVRVSPDEPKTESSQPRVSVSPDDSWTERTPWNNELNFRYRLVMNAFKAYATDVVKKHLNIKAEDIVKTVTKINGIKTTDQKWQTHADIENMDVVANLFGSDKNSPEAQRYAKAWAECRVNLLDPRFKERHHESEDDPWSYLAVARQLNVLLASVAKKLTTQDSKTIKNREAEYERWLAKKDVNNRKLVFMD
eukprot:Filipodium_phascolosomae@DN2530_c0_g1_i5.p1